MHICYSLYLYFVIAYFTLFWSNQHHHTHLVFLQFISYLHKFNYFYFHKLLIVGLDLCIAVEFIQGQVWNINIVLYFVF